MHVGALGVCGLLQAGHAHETAARGCIACSCHQEQDTNCPVNSLMFQCLLLCALGHPHLMAQLLGGPRPPGTRPALLCPAWGLGCCLPGQQGDVNAPGML